MSTIAELDEQIKEIACRYAGYSMSETEMSDIIKAIYPLMRKKALLEAANTIEEGTKLTRLKRPNTVEQDAEWYEGIEGTIDAIRMLAQ